MLNTIWKILLLLVVALDTLQNARALRKGAELKQGRLAQWLNTVFLAVMAFELGFDIIAGK